MDGDEMFHADRMLRMYLAQARVAAGVIPPWPSVADAHNPESPRRFAFLDWLCHMPFVPRFEAEL